MVHHRGNVEQLEGTRRYAKLLVVKETITDTMTCRISEPVRHPSSFCCMLDCVIRGSIISTYTGENPRMEETMKDWRHSVARIERWQVIAHFSSSSRNMVMSIAYESSQILISASVSYYIE